MAEENDQGQVVEPQEPVDPRGRKSTLGIPHKSGSKEYAREYYKRNKEKMNERMKQYHREHPEKSRAAVKKYQADHPDMVRESQKTYRDKINSEHAAIKSSGSTEKPRFEDSFGGGSTSEDVQGDGNG